MSRKAGKRPNPEMLPEYDFKGGVRGKHYARYREQVSAEPRHQTVLVTKTFVFQEKSVNDAARVGDLLFLVKGAYAVGIDAADLRGGREVLDLKRSLGAHIRHLNVDAIDALFTSDLGPASLIPKEMSYHSPLTLTLRGDAEGLLSAATLGGVDLSSEIVDKSETIRMPPVEDVITSLRRALAPKRAPIGYGIRSLTVKLAADEYAELMKHDPRTRSRGGFQKFLIGLQSRINRTTKEIELSEPEIKLIVRYGKNPGRGGWQSSIRRVFGRHFIFP